MTAYIDRSPKKPNLKTVSTRDRYGYGKIKPRNYPGGGKCCHRVSSFGTGKPLEIRCGSVERPDGRKGKPKCGWYGDTLERTISGRIMRCPDCLKEGRHDEQ